MAAEEGVFESIALKEVDAGRVQSEYNLLGLVVNHSVRPLPVADFRVPEKERQRERKRQRESESE